jgi:hypothetical protein
MPFGWAGGRCTTIATGPDQVRPPSVARRVSIALRRNFMYET